MTVAARGRQLAKLRLAMGMLAVLLPGCDDQPAQESHRSIPGQATSAAEIAEPSVANENRGQPSQRTPAASWSLDEWDGSAPLELRSLRGQVVFVRFWTDGCPFCARSMPAIQTLAEEFRGDPVKFVGLYHAKPFGSQRPWASAVEQARAWGVSFPIAYDREWKTLHRWWLNDQPRAATSASFVIDKQGGVVYIHPGPQLHPSDDPQHADCDRAFREVRRAIRQALAEN